jgi:RimJ/RimL family protein N-acetyltransferase
MRRVSLRDGELRLRPFGPEELEALVAARDVGTIGSRRTESEARRLLREKIERSGRFVEGRLDLGVELDGRLVGSVDARQARGAMPPGVYEFGIALFDEADRGRGVGSRAVRLLTDYLFSDPETHRVQASTWVENAAMRRVLEKLGYRLEGTMRAFMPALGGERHDYALYAVTRADWSQTSR